MEYDQNRITGIMAPEFVFLQIITPNKV